MLLSSTDSAKSKPLNFLVLCTGNSARSVMAEALFNHLGADRIQCFSAGSHPSGRVNPYALEQLAYSGIEVGSLHSKSWSEFTRPESPKIDVLVTVCAEAAREVCPVFNGDCEVVHWGLPDPAAVEGSALEISAAFGDCFERLSDSIDALMQDLPESADKSTAADQMRSIWLDKTA